VPSLGIRLSISALPHTPSWRAAQGKLYLPFKNKRVWHAAENVLSQPVDLKFKSQFFLHLNKHQAIKKSKE
jgi:hypothetical protein